MVGVSLQDLFTRYAGSDGVVDYRELQQILNELFANGLSASLILRTVIITLEE